MVTDKGPDSCTKLGGGKKWSRKHKIACRDAGHQKMLMESDFIRAQVRWFTTPGIEMAARKTTQYIWLVDHWVNHNITPSQPIIPIRLFFTRCLVNKIQRNCFRSKKCKCVDLLFVWSVRTHRHCMSIPREYLMYYRGTCFLAVVWNDSFSFLPLLLAASCLSFSVFCSVS